MDVKIFWHFMFALHFLAETNDFHDHQIYPKIPYRLKISRCKILFSIRGLIKINEAEGVETKLDGGWKQMHPASNYRAWFDDRIL